MDAGDSVEPSQSRGGEVRQFHAEVICALIRPPREAESIRCSSRLLRNFSVDKHQFVRHQQDMGVAFPGGHRPLAIGCGTS